ASACRLVDVPGVAGISPPIPPAPLTMPLELSAAYPPVPATRAVSRSTYVPSRRPLMETTLAGIGTPKAILSELIGEKRVCLSRTTIGFPHATTRLSCLLRQRLD